VKQSPASGRAAGNGQTSHARSTPSGSSTSEPPSSFSGRRFGTRGHRQRPKCSFLTMCPPGGRRNVTPGRAVCRSDEQVCQARRWARAVSARTARGESSTRDTARARLGPGVPSGRLRWSRCQRSVVKMSPSTRFRAATGGRDFDQVLHRSTSQSEERPWGTRRTIRQPTTPPSSQPPFGSLPRAGKRSATAQSAT